MTTASLALPETVEVAVARLDGRLTGIETRMRDHYEITKESRAEVKTSLAEINETLKSLTRVSDEWAGVRRALLAAAGVIGLICTILGVLFGYLRLGAK
jgi:CRISPR/Cas system-associated exonuclease Cas4 (RecB family)